jgi:simple sugar transport system ATP-binding protein
VSGAEAPALEVLGLTKRYGATEALRDVRFSVAPGEVLGLVGANGAGKTTLTRLVTGAVVPTSGSIRVRGRDVAFSHVADAHAKGVQSIPQSVDAALVPDLSAARNLTLPELAEGRLGRLPRRRDLDDRARRLAGDRLGFDLSTRVRDLDASQRQQLLIARALSTRPAVLVLDEPTAALSVVEQSRLHEDVRALAEAGTAIIYITHHLDEVERLCDAVVVLRDGQVTARLARPFTAADLVAPMLGRLQAAPSRSASRAGDPGRVGGPLLELRGVRSWEEAEPFDLIVHEGEVVGLTGLIGAGKTELLLQVVGARPRVSGSVRWHGEEFAPRDPRDAIRAGIGFVPEDRFRQGEIPGWSVAATLTLPDLGRYRGRSGLLDRRRENAAARTVMEALHLVASGPRAAIESLSGGNRQKAVVGRWLAASSRLLILDEPFRGVDIGARADIAAMLRGSGGALVASSDPEEILEVSDRVLIAAGGTVVGQVDPHDTSGEELTALMTTPRRQA